uniref:Uncharacterized protein n=1 Tax=viral metagenome TaxID=1070528 RepID=A0A6C0DQP7_9ZZZZ
MPNKINESFNIKNIIKPLEKRVAPTPAKPAVRNQVLNNQVPVKQVQQNTASENKPVVENKKPVALAVAGGAAAGSVAALAATENSKPTVSKQTTSNEKTEINDLNNNIIQLRKTINENNTKIEAISAMLHEANSSLQLTRKQLNDALIIVAKYNELYPKYLQLLKEYESLQKLYKKTKEELDEAKYLLKLNSETTHLTNEISQYNNYMKTLEKTTIEGFVESWTVGSDNKNVQYTLPPNTTGVNNATTTFNSIKHQNDILENQINKIKDIYSTDNQRVIYQTVNLDRLSLTNTYLFIFYYILVLTLIIGLLFFIKNVPLISKIILILLVSLYPIVIYQLEKFIYFIFMYFFSFFHGNVYFNDY